MNATLSELPPRARLMRAVALTILSLSVSASSALQAQAPATVPAPAAPVVVAPAPTTQAPATPATATPGSTSQAGGSGQTAGAVPGTSAGQTSPEAGFLSNPNPPDALTEFQQVVATSVGRTLPIFGESLFSGVPSTFAPVTDVPVANDYVLGPGDEINVQLVGQVNQQLSFAIDRTGAINIPGLGPVHVSGIPYGQLDGFLRAQFGRLYRNFTLTTTLGALRSIQVFVVGEARRPGSYSVSSLSTLLNAVFASGGPLPDGSLRDIQVKRDGKTLVHFDLYDLLLHGDKSKDIRLASGDVIFIPFAGPQVAVAGSVRTPAIYEVKGQATVSDLLDLAGGPNAVAAGGGVRLERVYEHSMRSVEDVNLATGGMQTVQNGDILSVAPILERFRNAVTLRGNVASPGRYVWHPGMRLSDLIPNKEALITRNYWTRRNQLGQLSLDYLPETTAPGSTAVNNPVPQNGQGALQVHGTAQATPESSTGNTSATQPRANGTDTTNGSNGDSQASGASRTPQLGAGGSQAGGTSVGAALTQSTNGFNPQTDVVLSAPDIDWSYAVVERLSTQTLKTSLLPFNLGELILDGDASQNYELQPGDVVTIFSTADIRVPTTEQTRYVRLEGEFLAPGVYSVFPGETLRGLLRRAGGFTPEAYLYASQFTRDSTRRLEAQRLQEYANQLDAQISAVTASNTARAISVSDQNAAGASAADARNAVARLRNTVPSGRIVLDLRPDSASIDGIPDLALEDGDRFVVPRVPSSVTVEGQVYNANAFVYRPNRRMMDYLQRAGGPDREADKKREFILRADGSVISRQYTDVRRAPVFPGDTLVVPPTIDRRAIFQRVIDLASVVSNFGFSAATLYLITRD